MHFPPSFRDRSPQSRVAPDGLAAALLLAIALPVAFGVLLGIAQAVR